MSPSFLRTPTKKEADPSPLKASDFLSEIHRAVLLGNPGGGKSTFTSKLCYDLATRHSERIFARRRVTPILVILRDYGAEKKATKCSILQFIEQTANSKYQISPPEGAFEYLLLNGHMLVIFDGLDELLETSYRQEVSSDVESFCNLYPAVPVLVTSRQVGYDQAPLDESRFSIFRLAPFDDSQVREYVNKWFAVDQDLTQKQQRSRAETFLDESRIVPDLRSNPLMLALMCNIYRGENYIPGNRPDVYEKCAIMLFERWDKSRGIHVQLPFEAHLRSAMMYLAHWIYTNEALIGGVSEKKLIEKASEYLCPRRFEDMDEARKAATDFIQFCRGRAWVFTDTGTTKEGDRLYQFTHRTFLEYFAAGNLVRTHPTPEKLIEVLMPRIARREWDVVAQLAFQLQNKNVEGGGDDLLDAVISRKTQDELVWNLYSFAARCLEFMVPSPRVTREITMKCLTICLDSRLREISREVRKKERIRELLTDVLYASPENRNAVGDTIENFLIDRICQGKQYDALLALDLTFHLTFALYRRHWDRMPDSQTKDFWESVSDRILAKCSDKVTEFCSKNQDTCIAAYRMGKVSLKDLLQWHGPYGVFRDARCMIFADIHFAPIADMLLHLILNPKIAVSDRKRFENDIHRLRELGEVLPTISPPWAGFGQGYPTSNFRWLISEHSPIQRKSIQLDLDSTATFGAFLLIAIACERDQTNAEKFFQTYSGTYLGPIIDIVATRFGRVIAAEVEAKLERMGFTTQQRVFAQRWLSREISFVHQQPRAKRTRNGTAH